MSAYFIGKLKGRREECRSFLQSAAGQSGLGLSFDVDPEDEQVLDEPEDIKGEGVTFSVSSEPGDSDIVEAWNSARDSGLKSLGSACPGSQMPDCTTNIEEIKLPDLVREELAGTSLGKFVSAVIGFRDSAGGGLALFDGSVRQIIRATPETCLGKILCALLVPWDCSPDALYVWTQAVTQ